VFDDVGQCLGDREVERGFDRGRWSVSEVAVDVDGQRHRQGQGSHGAVEAAFGQHRWVDAAYQVAQLR
jgi:hypothetical protein